MKEHAKKAIKHDFELLGKTVPTLAVIALFLVGGGSAALLTSFGTVSGDATVKQAITIDDAEFAQGEPEAIFSFDDEKTVAGETFVETETVNNNADVEASYKFVTSVPKEGIESRVYRDLGEKELSLVKNSDTSVKFDHDLDSDEIEFTFDKSDFEESKAAGPLLSYDSDNDGAIDFELDMASSEIPDYYGEGGNYEFKSGNGPDYKGEKRGISFSTSDSLVTVEIDRDKLGNSFGFAASVGGFKDVNPKENLQLVNTFGPQVETGAERDLEDGTVTRTYGDGEVTFRFSDPEASPVLGIDSDNDGVYDFQFDYNGVAVDYWTHDGSSWAGYGEYKDTDGDGLDDNPRWIGDSNTEIDAPEGVEISGGKKSEFVAISIDADRLNNIFRYAVGQNGDSVPGNAEADASRAKVVTSGVETLDSGESQDYVFVNDFAINLEDDDYTVSTDVVPIIQ